jgi:hypothetical protein
MEKLITIGQAAKFLGVSTQTLRRWDKAKQLISTRKPSQKKHRYYSLCCLEDFVQMSGLFNYAKKWAYHKSGFEPLPFSYCMDSSIFQARLSSFGQKLEKQTDKNLSSLVLSIIGEIGGNSFDHNLGNWPDILGILFAYNIEKKEIILADRGLGILKTLSLVCPKLSSNSKALQLAFSEVISGRSPEVRGNGLKYVRRVIVHNNIQLFFQTGNAFLKLKRNSQKLNIKQSKKYMPGCIAKINF